jgi:hypothetical protein
MASIEMVRNLLESLILKTRGSKDLQLRSTILIFLKLTLQTMQTHSIAIIAVGSKLHPERHLGFLGFYAIQCLDCVRAFPSPLQVDVFVSS